MEFNKFNIINFAYKKKKLNITSCFLYFILKNFKLLYQIINKKLYIIYSFNKFKNKGDII